MSTSNPRPAEKPRYNAIGLIFVVILVLLGFAFFFIGFLIAPLVLLTIFYFGLSAFDRNKRERRQEAVRDDQPGAYVTTETTTVVAPEDPAGSTTQQTRDTGTVSSDEATTTARGG